MGAELRKGPRRWWHPLGPDNNKAIWYGDEFFNKTEFCLPVPFRTQTVLFVATHNRGIMADFCHNPAHIIFCLTGRELTD